MVLRAGPRKVAAEDRLPQSDVAFREIRIDLNCCRSRFVSRCRAFAKWHHTEHAEPVVIISHARIRERVLRIERDCLLVADDGSRETIFSKRVPVKTSTQVSFVCLWIIG